MKCELCGKTPQFGHNVSHSKRHTLRDWDTNVHPARVMVEGKLKRMNICTRCMRTLNKQTIHPAHTG